MKPVAMQIGTALEPMIAKLYEVETGVSARRVNRLQRSKAHPWMLASLDRRRADGRLVELKWTERGVGYGEPGTDEVPDEVLVQLVQQMAVTGAPAALRAKPLTSPPEQNAVPAPVSSTPTEWASTCAR